MTKARGFVLLLLVAQCPLSAVGGEDTKPSPENSYSIAPGPFRPTWESLKQYKCPEWFRDAKLGIWAVWGPECVPEQGDWYARNMYIEGHAQYQHHLKTYGHPSKHGYKDIVPLWKAEKWDPDRLTALYKKAGAKYFCVIAQHHDNFDCWNSKHHEWNSVNYGPKKDITGLWAVAAKKQGLRFGVTEHLGASWWWFNVAKGADKKGPLAGIRYDGANPKFAGLYHWGNEKAEGWYATNAPESWKREWFNRIKDLVDSYQPDLLYSDGGIPYEEVGRSIVAHFYNQNLGWHGGKLEAVYNCKGGGCGYVLDLERGIQGNIMPEPWQTDTCVGDWYYHRGIYEGHRYKSAGLIVGMLADIVSKNGNLLLNFPPRSDGTLDPDEEKILSDMAAWMAVNEECIFGTRPWKVYGEGPAKTKGGHFNEASLRYTSADIRFTTKGPALYAIVLAWPADGKVTVRSLAKAAGKVAAVSLLGHAGPLDWAQTDEGLVVSLPRQKPCENAFALKIAGEDLKPAPLPPHAIRPGKDGRIVLPAVEAEIHGSSPQYETGGGKDNIGYWADPNDYVSWDFSAAKPGTYQVELTYSCASGAEGSQYTVTVGGQAITGISKVTGDWAKFTSERLGTVQLEKSGTYTLNVKPKAEPKWKVIGLKSVTLVPSP